MIKAEFDNSKIITITDKQNICFTGQFKPSQSQPLCDIDMNCVMINDDLYLVVENRMIVIQKLTRKLMKLRMKTTYRQILRLPCHI